MRHMCIIKLCYIKLSLCIQFIYLQYYIYFLLKIFVIYYILHTNMSKNANIFIHFILACSGCFGSKLANDFLATSRCLWYVWIYSATGRLLTRQLILSKYFVFIIFTDNTLSIFISNNGLEYIYIPPLQLPSQFSVHQRSSV